MLQISGADNICRNINFIILWLAIFVTCYLMLETANN